MASSKNAYIRSKKIEIHLKLILNSASHSEEVAKNLEHWKRKPLLQKIYRGFYEMIASYLGTSVKGAIVEIGSGIGSINEVIPQCIRTDIMPGPMIDQMETAYNLSFPDESVSNLILFDVFHHLRYPGAALKEFHRVLAKNGRLIIFEPCISLLGLIVYGFLHHEPLGLSERIRWFEVTGNPARENDYYAAQANASRVFFKNKPVALLKDWTIVFRKRLSSISYLASGGYSGPQLYPTNLLPLIQLFDRVCDWFPGIFSSRLFVILEKNRQINL